MLDEKLTLCDSDATGGMEQLSVIDIVIDNTEQSCVEHRVNVSLPQGLCEGKQHHYLVPGVQWAQFPPSNMM